MPPESPTADVTPLKVALLGAGAMGRHHATALGRCRRPVRLIGVADPDPEARAALGAGEGGTRGFSTTDELLEALDPDIAHVCTPPGSHADLAVRALESGAHVYVEKPFAPTLREARRILEVAEARSLRVCPGHQLLFERPSREVERLLPALGDVVHVESFFSFRAVKTRAGRASLSPDEQLIDVLPHPTYLLLRFLELAQPQAAWSLAALEVGPAGTVHAIVRRGTVTATLLVTLEGRPVESFVRIVGTHGTVTADYVRGITLRAIGPGSSGIDKLLQPYRQAKQLVGRTTVAMGRRIRSRRKSYAGLVEIFDALHDAVVDGAPSPVSRDNILGTVELCEEVSTALAAPAGRVGRPIQLGGPSQSDSTASLEGGETEAPPDRPSVSSGPDPDGPSVLVTGGTDFIGREIVRELVTLLPPHRVRVVARRAPAPWEAIPGVEYLTLDLGEDPLADALADVRVVVHCAAATAGGWDAHERSSIAASRRLVREAAEAGARGVIHLSSLGVLSKDGRARVTEETSLDADPRRAGPYVWGKLESERVALEEAESAGLALKVVRPAPVVDYRAFEPPGRLGRRLGNLFVSVGSPGKSVAVVDVRFVARAVAWMVTHLDEAPATVNLLDPKLPTRGELVARLRDRNPDVRVVWLPMPLLRPLSWIASGVQRVLRPGRRPVDIAKVFREPLYDTAMAARLAASIDSWTAEHAVPALAGGCPPSPSAPRVDRENPCSV